MLTHWFRRPALLSMSLSATLAATFAGCGGQSDSSTAVVVPEPNSVTTKAAAGNTPAPATAAASTAESTPATATRKADGWGTLKGHVLFAGDPPPAAILQDKGKAAKDPEVCAKDGVAVEHTGKVGHFQSCSLLVSLHAPRIRRT